MIHKRFPSKKRSFIYTQSTAIHSVSHLYVGISGSYSGSHIYMPESQLLSIYTYLKFRNDLHTTKLLSRMSS